MIGFRFVLREIRIRRRKRDVLRLLILGMDNELIAQKLYISIATTKTHIHNICQKFGVKTRVELLEHTTDKVLIQETL